MPTSCRRAHRDGKWGKGSHVTWGRGGAPGQTLGSPASARIPELLREMGKEFLTPGTADNTGPKKTDKGFPALWGLWAETFFFLTRFTC